MTDVVLLMRGVLALLAGTIAVSASQVLRADSDGPAPGVGVSIAAALVAAALFWPLTRRRHNVLFLYGGLVALQVAGHALLTLASTGRISSGGAVGLVCCRPDTAAAGGGPLSSLTADAGWLLLSVQLLAAFVLTLSLRVAQGAALSFAGTAARVIHALLPAPTALLRLLGLRPVVVPAPRRTAAPPPLLLRGRTVSASVRRRGPPAGGFFASSGPPPSCLRGAVAL